MPESSLPEFFGYRSLRKLNMGTFSEGYEVEHLLLKCIDAVKLLRPESDFRGISPQGDDSGRYRWALHRFWDETRGFRSCEHKNIVRFFSCGELSDGRPYMVLEYYSKNLGQLIGDSPIDRRDQKNQSEPNRCLEPETVLELARSILSALDYLHHKEITHHDIKPRNIFRSPEGIWKLSDFGLVQSFEDFHVACKLGGAETVYCAPPELQMPGFESSLSGDLYSLGVVLYRCLSGEYPLFGSGQLNQKFPKIPPELSDFVYRLLCRWTSDSFNSASEALTFLKPLLLAPDLTASAKLIQEDQQTEELVLPKVKVSKEPLNWVRIDEGTFQMGSPELETDRCDREGPVHEVVITSPFFIKDTPVTQSQWFQLMGTKPWHFKNAGKECPAESLTWYDALAYCNALSRQEGFDECYQFVNSTGTAGKNLKIDKVIFKGLKSEGYRLPTEAEWEYACRAETKGAIYSDKLHWVAWYTDNSFGTIHPVREKEANIWGLFDSLGNVWEWCWDIYGEYSSELQTDPVGPESGSFRVFRGGSWFNPSGYCRLAYRLYDTPDSRGYVGLRPVRSLKKKKSTS